MRANKYGMCTGRNPSKVTAFTVKRELSKKEASAVSIDWLTRLIYCDCLGGTALSV